MSRHAVDCSASRKHDVYRVQSIKVRPSVGHGEVFDTINAALERTSIL